MNMQERSDILPRTEGCILLSSKDLENVLPLRWRCIHQGVHRTGIRIYVRVTIPNPPFGYAVAAYYYKAAHRSWHLTEKSCPCRGFEGGFKTPRGLQQDATGGRLSSIYLWLYRSPGMYSC